MPVDDGVQVHFLVVRGQPLLVAACPTTGRGPQLHATLAERGLARLDRFLGTDLPKGARVGVTLAGEELRLEDDTGATLLRAPRHAVDPDWSAAAKRLRGTMAVVALGEDLDADLSVAELAGRLDATARDGRLLGAIIGVAEERLTLPLLLG